MLSLTASLYLKTKPRKTKQKPKHPASALRPQLVWIRPVYWAQCDQSHQGHPGESPRGDPGLVIPAAVWG